MIIRIPTLAAVIFITTSQCATATTCRPWQANDGANSNLKIGDIRIDPHNIFATDTPEESAWFHKLGNRLHFRTREHTVAGQLLFKTGDAFSQRLLDETARNLRGNRYIKTASVTPTRVCGDAVNVDVTTVDHWTFTPNISFSRSGSEGSSTYEIEENNLFGTGKRLGLIYDQAYERTYRIIEYHDPQVLGSRYRFNLKYEDNSDGGGYSTAIALPFFQLDSRYAWGVTATDDESSAKVYENGKNTMSWRHLSEDYGVEFGWSPGYQEGEVNRFRVGWNYLMDKFDNIADPESYATPKNRNLSYPWVGYERLDESYVQIPNLTVMDSVQDVYVGQRFNAQLGYAPKSLNDDANYVVAAATFARSFQPQPHELTQFRLGTSAVLGDGDQNNTRISGSFDWYHFLSRYYTFIVSGSALAESNQPLDQQYLLGGEEDLRGYPLRFQDGDRLVHLTAEQRHMYSAYPWRLFQFASAAFLDVGSAWNKGEDPDWISDVGIGVRVFPTRSSGQVVLHADVAFPIDPDKGIDSVQVTIATKASF